MYSIVINIKIKDEALICTIISLTQLDNVINWIN